MCAVRHFIFEVVSSECSTVANRKLPNETSVSVFCSIFREAIGIPFQMTKIERHIFSRPFDENFGSCQRSHVDRVSYLKYPVQACWKKAHYLLGSCWNANEFQSGCVIT